MTTMTKNCSTSDSFHGRIDSYIMTGLASSFFFFTRSGHGDRVALGKARCLVTHYYNVINMDNNVLNICKLPRPQLRSHDKRQRHRVKASKY